MYVCMNESEGRLYSKLLNTCQHSLLGTGVWNVNIDAEVIKQAENSQRATFRTKGSLEKNTRYTQ